MGCAGVSKELSIHLSVTFRHSHDEMQNEGGDAQPSMVPSLRPLHSVPSDQEALLTGTGSLSSCETHLHLVQKDMVRILKFPNTRKLRKIWHIGLLSTVAPSQVKSFTFSRLPFAPPLCRVNGNTS